MDKLSILRIVLVTIPETILTIYIALLITYRKLSLPFFDNPNMRKDNIVKLLLATVIISSEQYLARTFISTLNNVLLMNMSTMFIVLWAIYGKKIFKCLTSLLNSWGIALFQVLTISVSIAVPEAIYFPIILQNLGITMTDLYAPQYTLLQIFIPQIDRFAQILALCILTDWQRLKVNATLYGINKYILNVLVCFIMIIELIFGYMFIYYFDLYNLSVKVILFVIALCMCILNYTLPKMAIKILKKVSFNHGDRKEIKL